MLGYEQVGHGKWGTSLTVCSRTDSTLAQSSAAPLATVKLSQLTLVKDLATKEIADHISILYQKHFVPF